MQQMPTKGVGQRQFNRPREERREEGRRIAGREDRREDRAADEARIVGRAAGRAAVIFASDQHQLQERLYQLCSGEDSEVEQGAGASAGEVSPEGRRRITTGAAAPARVEAKRSPVRV